MAVRKVYSSGRNMTGLFPSLKLRRMVAFESLIEQDYLYVLDYEREVVFFEEQPLSIEYVWDGKKLRYTPDFHVIRGEIHELVECKPLVFVNTEDNQRKFSVAQTWCKDQGWSFSVITDQDLRQSHRLSNIKLLTRYARWPISDSSKQRVKDRLGKKTVATLLELAQYLAPNDPAQGVGILLSLAFHHEITISLTAGPISHDSLISLMEVKTT